MLTIVLNYNIIMNIILKLNNNINVMSLDNKNVYTPKYEKQDEDDRDIRELKIEINSYFSTISSFLEESKDLSVTTDKNKNIAELTTLISDRQKEIASIHNPEHFRKVINEEVISKIIGLGSSLLKDAYIDKFNTTISKLQKRIEKSDNPDVVLNIRDAINDLSDRTDAINSFEFKSLSSYVYGVEFFKNLNNEKFRIEKKSIFETSIIKLEKDYQETKDSDIDKTYKIQVLRQYIDIINSYEKAIDLLSA